MVFGSVGLVGATHAFVLSLPFAEKGVSGVHGGLAGGLCWFVEEVFFVSRGGGADGVDVQFQQPSAAGDASLLCKLRVVGFVVHARTGADSGSICVSI